MCRACWTTGYQKLLLIEPLCLSCALVPVAPFRLGPANFVVPGVFREREEFIRRTLRLAHVPTEQRLFTKQVLTYR